MSSAQWYYLRGGVQQPPVLFDELRQLAASGSLQRNDLVWSAQMPQWAAAASIADLFPAGAAPPPIPSIPVGYYVPQQQQVNPNDIGQNAGIRMLLPVGRSGWAIAAGYLGLFSVIFFPAPLALLCGIMAIFDIKRHPDRHGMGRAIFGIIMGGLGTLALIFFLGGYAFRRF